MASAKPSRSELLELYEKFDYILHINDGLFYMNIIRWIGWGIIKSLQWINDFIEDAVYSIVGVQGFYESGAIDDITDVIVPIAFGLFVVSLIILGFQFMMNKIEKREEIILNVLMAASVIFLIPVLVTNMHNVLGFGVDELDGLSPSLSGNVIQSNIADLSYYMEKEFQTDEEKDNNYYGDEDLPPLPQSTTHEQGTTDFTYGNTLDERNPAVEITETIDIQEDEGWFTWTTEDWVNDLKDNNPVAYEFMLKKRLPTGEGNKYGIVDLNKNNIPGTSIGREAYYRYHVNWGTIIFTLLVTAFALAITLIKVGRMMFDIVFTMFFGMVVAPTDLTGGQRTKKVLLELANSFGVLLVMVFIMQLFIYYANWVNTLRADIGIIPVILMLIAGAWAVMDAPDIVQRMMGIDAGLRSGYGALMGAAAATSLAGKAGKGAKSMASGALTKGAGLAGMASGGLKSLKSGQSSVPKIPSSGNGTPNGLTNENGNGNGTGKENLTSQSDSGKTQPKEREGNQTIPNSTPRTQDDIKKNPPKKKKEDDKKKLGNSQGLQDAKQGKIPNGYSKTKSGLVIPSSNNSEQGISSNGQESTQNPTIPSNPHNNKGNQNVPNSDRAQTTPIPSGTDIGTGQSTGDGVQNPTIPSNPNSMSGGTQNVASPENAQNPTIPSNGSNQFSGNQHIGSPSSQQMPNSAQQQPIPKQAGIFTGSQMYQRMQNSFQRGQVTGSFLGSGTKKMTAPIARPMVKGVQKGTNLAIGGVKEISKQGQTALGLNDPFRDYELSKRSVKKIQRKNDR